MNPSAMPKGYYHHQDVYKAAPGPNSDELGYDYSLEKNEEILLAWREVVGDLVTQFLARHAGDLFLEGIGECRHDHMVRYRT